MNEPEKIDPRELSPLALAFVGDSMLELLKEALSPKSITLNKGEKQFQLHQISL